MWPGGWKFFAVLHKVNRTIFNLAAVAFVGGGVSYRAIVDSFLSIESRWSMLDADDRGSADGSEEGRWIGCYFVLVFRVLIAHCWNHCFVFLFFLLLQHNQQPSVEGTTPHQHHVRSKIVKYIAFNLCISVFHWNIMSKCSETNGTKVRGYFLSLLIGGVLPSSWWWMEIDDNGVLRYHWQCMWESTA